MKRLINYVIYSKTIEFIQKQIAKKNGAKKCATYFMHSVAFLEQTNLLQLSLQLQGNFQLNMLNITSFLYIPSEQPIASQ
ncbi:hypothetical protein BRADI_1g37317v3 [Brachypodium distachyon]|uniref:Uncharacterized protein n=1 Tax=Brachypodium distachyon TaxID=15368 RepID=A0A0Q3JJW1_BRADI|nr:hypothetical protein BRADI_1g37317v3 [Brachypodium distachyon]